MGVPPSYSILDTVWKVGACTQRYMHGWLAHSEASPCMYTAGHSGKGAYATYHADSGEVVDMMSASSVCLLV